MRNFNKKALAVTLATILGALSVSPIISVAADSGDINSDNTVTSNDIALLSDYILTKSYSANNADITGDKNVDVFDLCALRNSVNNPQTTPPQPSHGIPDYGTEMNADATMVADFRKGATPLFFASDGWENGDPFDCGWYEENTSLDNNMLSLTIDRDHTGKYNYSGAEYRTADHYHYGYYETSMQAIKNDGVVSSFFTYTGPSEDNPWDEIDIEILGKDTTKVQLNYYTNGVGGHEYMYDLGFDASEGFHTYGFDWQPDHITWYVDGKAVYTAYNNIPKTPGRIMMNTWPGRGVNEWLNAYNGKTPLTAHYQWVTFNESGSNGNNNNNNNNGNNGDNVQITAPSGSGNGVSDNFEGNGTSWTGRGTVDYGFASGFAHGGSKALYVTNRTQSWNGVSVSSDELKAGSTYNISAFVGYNSNQFSTSDFSMGLQYDLNGTTKYDAVADATCSTGKWAELNSDFTIPAGATSISLYVQSAYTETAGAKDILPFYLDDVVLTVKSTGNNNNGNNTNNGITDFGTPMSTNATMTADFRKGATPLFFASDGWENGDPFDCGWYESNTSLANNMLSLTIDRDYTGKYNYSGAEYRTADHYHYGYYETSMQAIKNDGVVSSFFTYTGPSEDNPWDEIDIEILGKDTTKVQLNYYTSGVGNHEFMYDLGFDASEGFHTYGFDWQPDHITWYVDGKAVYTAYNNIPKTPGRIMMNAWPGRGVKEWLNAFNGKTPLTARYQWVTYTKK